jgi:hypothetical protein
VKREEEKCKEFEYEEEEQVRRKKIGHPKRRGSG